VKSIITKAVTAVVALAAAATIIGGAAAPATADSALAPASAAEIAALPAGPSTAEVGYRIGATADQAAEWARLTATPEQRAQIVADLKESFAGVAEVHVETGPSAGRFAAMPDLAYGYNGHFWVTLSYADAINGLIDVGVRYCSTRIPGWICNIVGNLLKSMVSGWGWANNHGVWGAAYWSGYVTGGRW
jgi:hypothetical protein